MADNDRIKITISKSEDGFISVDTKTSDGVTDDEVGQLALDFIECIMPEKNRVLIRKNYKPIGERRGSIQNELINKEEIQNE